MMMRSQVRVKETGALMDSPAPNDNKAVGVFVMCPNHPEYGTFGTRNFTRATQGTGMPMICQLCGAELILVNSAKERTVVVQPDEHERGQCEGCPRPRFKSGVIR